MICFGRTYSFSHEFNNPPSNRRGFLFNLDILVSAPLNPLTGMTANLSALDDLLHQIIARKEINMSPEELLEFFWGELQAEQVSCGFHTQELKLQEKRGLGFRKKADLKSDYQFLHSCYIENIKDLGALLEIQFTWEVNGVQESFIDISSRGISLLKDLPASLNSELLIRSLQKLMTLENKKSGIAKLSEIQIKSQSPDYILTIMSN